MAAPVEPSGVALSSDPGQRQPAQGFDTKPLLGGGAPEGLLK